MFRLMGKIVFVLCMIGIGFYQVFHHDPSMSWWQATYHVVGMSIFISPFIAIPLFESFDL